jgi:hypothetical protein
MEEASSQLLLEAQIFILNQFYSEIFILRIEETLRRPATVDHLHRLLVVALSLSSHSPAPAAEAQDSSGISLHEQLRRYATLDMTKM